MVQRKILIHLVSVYDGKLEFACKGQKKKKDRFQWCEVHLVQDLAEVVVASVNFNISSEKADQTTYTEGPANSVLYFFTQYLAYEWFQEKRGYDFLVIKLCIIIQNVHRVPKAQGRSLQRLLYVQKSARKGNVITLMKKKELQRVTPA